MPASRHLGGAALTSTGIVMHIILDRCDTMEEARPKACDVAAAAGWIIDALADELASDSARDAQTLLAALQRRLGYEEADGMRDGSSQHWRSELTLRLIHRIGGA